MNQSIQKLCLARAMAGDKSDNLPGIKGAGLKTIAKRFHLIREDVYEVSDIIRDCAMQTKNLSYMRTSRQMKN